MSDDSQGLSLKLVASMSIGLIAFLLWGGAAAIYKNHVSPVSGPQAELVGAGEPEGAVEDSSTGSVRFRVGRGSGLVAAVVVTVLGVATFLWNSITQLAHLPSVVMLIVTERQGYLLFCIIVLAASVLGFFWMGRVQQSLASGSPFKTNRKKKKLPKIRTPKPTDL
jgi:hypothetical protein